MSQPIIGEELIKALKSFIPGKNCSERHPSENGVGTFLRISYPEFGMKMIMTLGVGELAETTIYNHVEYREAWIMVLPAENVTEADLQKSLNDTYVNMIIQCQCNIRDALENVLQQRVS